MQSSWGLIYPIASLSIRVLGDFKNVYLWRLKILFFFGVGVGALLLPYFLCRSRFSTDSPVLHIRARAVSFLFVVLILLIQLAEVHEKYCPLLMNPYQDTFICTVARIRPSDTLKILV